MGDSPIEALIHRCLQKHPEERFCSGQAALEFWEGCAHIDPGETIDEVSDDNDELLLVNDLSVDVVFDESSPSKSVFDEPSAPSLITPPEILVGERETTNGEVMTFVKTEPSYQQQGNHSEVVVSPGQRETSEENFVPVPERPLMPLRGPRLTEPRLVIEPELVRRGESSDEKHIFRPEAVHSTQIVSLEKMQSSSSRKSVWHRLPSRMMGSLSATGKLVILSVLLRNGSEMIKKR